MKTFVRKILLVFISLMVLCPMLPQMTFAADYAPPQITSLKVNKKTVAPGDKIKITCNVTDKSKVKEVVISFRNGSRYTETISLTKNESGIFTASYKIPKNLVNGNYFLGYLSAVDSKGNRYETYDPNDYPGAMFTVKSASKDRKAPVIKKISINKNTVSPGAKVTITCEIQDDSELNLDPERSYLYMKNKSQISQPFVFVKKRKNVYTATQTIPENYVNGTYNLSTVVLTDAVGNSLRASGKDYPDLLFTVKNASSDRKAPVVSKVTIDKQSASPGDKLKISVYYSDSSEIVSGGLNSYIVFRNGSFTSNRISLKKKKEGLLTGTLTVDSSYMNGTYELWMMRITDVVGNSLQVNGASTYPLVKFKVKNGNKPSDYDRNGWFMMNGKWYFNDQNRKLVKGWMYYNAKWYYMNLKTGEMQTDWVKVNGKWYYLDPTSGAMQTGWLQLTENWYFLDPSSGAMQTGWLQWKEKWYYLKPSGKMCEKEWFGGYRFSKSGAWTYKYIGSWKKNSIGWWFGDTSGWYAKNTRIKIDDVYYRFNKEGYWVE